MKKRIALLLSAALLAGIFSACGQDPGAQESPSPSTPPQSSGQPGTEPTQDSIYAPYQGTELVFLRHSGYEADWMTEKAEEFYQLSGIRVTVEQIAYSEMKNKILLDISSTGGAYERSIGSPSSARAAGWRT